MSYGSAAFDEAIALGHRVADDRHLLLALLRTGPEHPALEALRTRGVTHATAVAQMPTSARDPERGRLGRFDGCLGTASLVRALAWASGLALGSDRQRVTVDHLLVALLARGSPILFTFLSRLGVPRSRARQCLRDDGAASVTTLRDVANPWLDAARRQADELEHDFVGDWHVLLALLSAELNDTARRILEANGLVAAAYRDRIRAWLSCPPPSRQRTDASPKQQIVNARCWNLLSCAEAIAAAQRRRTVSSEQVLVAFIWGDAQRPAFDLETAGTGKAALAAALANTEVPHPSFPPPASPPPHPPTEWGSAARAPVETVPLVVSHLSRVLMSSRWWCDVRGTEAVFIAEKGVDLGSLVEEALAASRGSTRGAQAHRGVVNHEGI